MVRTVLLTTLQDEGCVMQFANIGVICIVSQIVSEMKRESEVWISFSNGILDAEMTCDVKQS